MVVIFKILLRKNLFITLILVLICVQFPGTLIIQLNKISNCLRVKIDYKFTTESSIFWDNNLFYMLVSMFLSYSVKNADFIFIVLPILIRIDFNSFSIFNSYSKY